MKKVELSVLRVSPSWMLNLAIIYYCCFTNLVVDLRHQSSGGLVFVWWYFFSYSKLHEILVVVSGQMNLNAHIRLGNKNERMGPLSLVPWAHEASTYILKNCIKLA